MYPEVLLCHQIFFAERAHWNFGKNVVILSGMPTVSCSSGRSFSVLRRPKTTPRSTMGQEDCLSHLTLLSIECAYFNRVDIEKLFDKLSSKKIVPSSFSNQFLDQKTLVIYFESCKKNELVNSMLTKGNLRRSY